MPLLRILRAAAAWTLAAFTLSAVVPAGFAEVLRRRDTLRAQAGRESEVEGRLEERIGAGLEEDPAEDLAARLMDKDSLAALWNPEAALSTEERLALLYAYPDGLWEYLRSFDYFDRMREKKKNQFREAAHEIRSLIPDWVLEGSGAAGIGSLQEKIKRQLVELNLPPELAEELAMGLLMGRFMGALTDRVKEQGSLPRALHARLFADRSAVQRLLLEVPHFGSLSWEDQQSQVEQLRGLLKDYSLRLESPGELSRRLTRLGRNIAKLSEQAVAEHPATQEEAAPTPVISLPARPSRPRSLLIRWAAALFLGAHVSLPAEAIPPAAPAAPATGGIGAIRAAEQQQLRLGGRGTTIREQTDDKDLQRALKLNAKAPGVIAADEIERRRLLQGQHPVFQRQRTVLEILEEFLEADEDARPALWRRLEGTLQEQMRMERASVKADVFYMESRLAGAKETDRRRQERGDSDAFTEGEEDRYAAALEKARIRFQQLEGQEVLYEKLARLTTLPLPLTSRPGAGLRDVRNTVPPLPNPNPPPTGEEREQLLRDVRAEVSRLLELEKQILQVDIDWWPRRVARASKAHRDGAMPEERLKRFELLVPMAALRQEQQGVLTAQQGLLAAVEPADQVAAQQALDAAAQKLLGAIVDLWRARDEQGSWWRSRVEALLDKAASTEGELDKAWLDSALAHDQLELWQVQQELSGYHLLLGNPVPLPEGSTLSPGSFEAGDLFPALGTAPDPETISLRGGPTTVPRAPQIEVATRRPAIPAPILIENPHSAGGLTVPRTGTAGFSLLRLSALVTPVLPGLREAPDPETRRNAVRAIRRLDLRSLEIQALDLLHRMRAALRSHRRIKHPYREGAFSHRQYEASIDKVRMACAEIARAGALMAERAMGSEGAGPSEEFLEALRDVEKELQRLRQESPAGEELIHLENQVMAERGALDRVHAELDAAEKGLDQSRIEIRKRQFRVNDQMWKEHETLYRKYSKLRREMIEMETRRSQLRMFRSSAAAEARLSETLERLAREVTVDVAPAPRGAVQRYESWSMDEVALERRRVEEHLAEVRDHWLPGMKPWTREGKGAFTQKEIDRARAEVDFLENHQEQLIAQESCYAESAAAGHPLVKPQNPASNFSSQDDPRLRPGVRNKETARFLGTVRVFRDGEWREAQLFREGWMRISRPTYVAGERWPEELGYTQDSWTKQEVIRGRPLTIFGDLAHHVDARLPGSLGEVVIEWQTFWSRYEVPPGWFYVQGIEGGYMLASRPGVLGYQLEPLADEEASSLFDENGQPLYVLVSYTVKQVVGIPLKGGGVERGAFPVGVVVRRVPMKEYRAFAEPVEGKVKPLSEGPGVDYGRIFFGDWVTYEEEGEKRYGILGKEPTGDVLPRVLVREGDRNVERRYRVRNIFKRIGAESGEPEWQTHLFNASDKKAGMAELEPAMPGPNAEYISVLLQQVQSALQQTGLKRGVRPALEQARGDLRGDLRMLPTLGQGDADRDDQIRHNAREHIAAASALLGRMGLSPPAADPENLAAQVLRVVGEPGVSQQIRQSGWASLAGIAGFREGDFLIDTGSGTKVALPVFSGVVVYQGGLPLPLAVGDVKLTSSTPGELAWEIKALHKELQKSDSGLSVNDALVFNAEQLRPDQIVDCIPEGLRGRAGPAAVAFQPRALKKLNKTQFWYILAVSRQTGPLYIYRITPIDVGDQSYLLVQA